MITKEESRQIKGALLGRMQETLNNEVGRTTITPVVANGLIQVLNQHLSAALVEFVTTEEDNGEAPDFSDLVTGGEHGESAEETD